jgi:hypothetical protein
MQFQTPSKQSVLHGNRKKIFNSFICVVETTTLITSPIMLYKVIFS